MKRVLEIQDKDFTREVVGSKVPVVVDFFADWCPPCRRLAPMLEQLAETYGEKIKIVKINTDRERQWAEQLGVRGLPTLAFFLNGKLVAQETGLLPYPTLVQAIESLLKRSAA